MRSTGDYYRVRQKNILIDKDDYIALYNMAEYSELLIQEQDKMDRLYWGVVDD